MKESFKGVEVSFVGDEIYLKQNTCYMLVFPDGTIYIGKTTKTLKKRIIDHINAAIGSGKQKVCTVIKKYMRFDVELLPAKQEMGLDKEEEYYINTFMSTNPLIGHNINVGNKHPIATRNKSTNMFFDDFKNSYSDYGIAAAYYNTSVQHIKYLLKKGTRDGKIGTGFYYDIHEIPFHTN